MRKAHAMDNEDCWLTPKDIPLDLNLLREYLNSDEDCNYPGDYTLRVYTVDALNTNFARPCFALVEGADGGMEDVFGTLEDTLHLILDNGAQEDDVYRIMGLVREDEIEEDMRAAGEYVVIDDGYCVAGNIVSWEEVPEHVASIENVLEPDKIAQGKAALASGSDMSEAVEATRRTVWKR